MPESTDRTGRAEGEQPEVTPGALKEQAQWLRQTVQSWHEEFLDEPLPGWRKTLYLLLILFVLSSVIWLLIAGHTRRQIVGAIGEQVVDLYAGRQSDIFKLPPPPPQAVQSKVVVPQVSVSSGETEEGASGVLFLDGQPLSTVPGEEERPARPVAPARTAANQEAYNFLLNKSEIALKLVRKELEEFDFKGWKPVKNNPPEFWIDLAAVRQSDGQEVHLIWSVNIESGQIKALSQAARDLEASQAGK